MEYLQYYKGLTKGELRHNDTWLIVIIEAAWYCDSHHEKYIRYSPLKERSNEALNRLTEGERSIGSGTFRSILESRRYKRYLRIVKVSDKEKRIYPNIPLIQQVIKARQNENVNNDSGRFTYYYHRKLNPEIIEITDNAKVSVSKAKLIRFS